MVIKKVPLKHDGVVIGTANVNTETEEITFELDKSNPRAHEVMAKLNPNALTGISLPEKKFDFSELMKGHTLDHLSLPPIKKKE